MLLNKFFISIRLSIISLLLLTPLLVQADANTSAIGKEAVTVFYDTTIGDRRAFAAREMSRLHQLYARQGWTFADLSPYIENGDLVGFFLTYTRPATPNLWVDLPSLERPGLKSSGEK